MTRGPTTAPFGKLTEELRVGIDEETKNALIALAFAAGKPLAEYIREWIHLHVDGHAAVLRSRMAP